MGILKFFRDLFAPVKPEIMEAVECGDIAGTRRILHASPSEINVKDDTGQRPLHAAAAHNALEIAIFLIDHGAEINAKRDNDATALHLAVGSGNIEMVQMLLKRGADPNAKGDKGVTPLHLAAVQGKRHLIRILIAGGGREDLLDEFGKMPSDWLWTEIQHVADGGSAQKMRMDDGNIALLSIGMEMVIVFVSPSDQLSNPSDLAKVAQIGAFNLMNAESRRSMTRENRARDDERIMAMMRRAIGLSSSVSELRRTLEALENSL